MKNLAKDKRSSRLTCFKDYDIRGIYGVELTEEIAFRVGKAIAITLKANKVAIGYDSRFSSAPLAKAVSNGLMEFGVEVLDLGMVGTEEMYWAVSDLNTCAGVEITASHNPIEYNGIKIVKSGSRPLSKAREFEKIHTLVRNNEFQALKNKGTIKNVREIAKSSYERKILSFIDLNLLKPIKIVVNSGNGTAAPTFNRIKKFIESQGVSTNFICINHEVDPSFQNGVPNPLLISNRNDTSKAVIENEASFGVAFDADFDRCFVFNELGEFVHSSQLSSLLAKDFLLKEPGSVIVHDSRLIWAIKRAVLKNGGKLELSKAGHANIKLSMRKFSSIYGSEISGHHYFREFCYCDSGMIPWLILWCLISKENVPLSRLLSSCNPKVFISDEISFEVFNREKAIKKVLDYYKADATHIDTFDGISLEFKDWRFNLRPSSTEPLIRLNLESKFKKKKLDDQIQEIINVCKLASE